MFEIPNNQLLKELGDPTLVVCVPRCMINGGPGTVAGTDGKRHRRSEDFF